MQEEKRKLEDPIGEEERGKKKKNSLEYQLI
jgi:hypothetical protein